jgi:predicted RNase H-like nuclease (RuvC/YqgF family)
VDRLAQQLENENKVQLLTTVISNKDTIVENLQVQLTEKDRIIKSLQEELESLKSQLLLSLNTTNTQIGWE